MAEFSTGGRGIDVHGAIERNDAEAVLAYLKAGGNVERTGQLDAHSAASMLLATIRRNCAAAADQNAVPVIWC
jgi:hypothetical protein